MINNNRIVPVTALDLITLYGLILKQDTTNNSTLAKVDAVTDDGAFEIESASTPLIASEPVKSCDFASAVTSATLYFVPAYNFEGFTLNKVATEPSGTIVADGRTLYKAVLATGTVTVTKCGF